jgi:hypothetical protein
MIPCPGEYKMNKVDNEILINIYDSVGHKIFEHVSNHVWCEIWNKIWVPVESQVYTQFKNNIVI